MTDASGNIVGEQRYRAAPLPKEEGGYPYGETRLVSGSMYTDRLFTGQREMAGLGIYHYGARFYSPKLGRFVSADPIVPGAGNPQAFNRYSYALNNPVRYTDPSGYKICDDVDAYGRCITYDYGDDGSSTSSGSTWSGNDGDGDGGGGDGGGSGGYLASPLAVDITYFDTTINALYTNPPPPTPDWGKFIAGDVVLLAGEITMVLGGLTIASAFAEHAAGLAAAPATFGLSEVLAVIHTPVVLALGGLIFTAGAATSYYGGKLMLDSGVPSWLYGKLTEPLK